MSKLPGYRDTETCNENHKRFVCRVVENEIVWSVKSQNGWANCISNDEEERPVLLFWSDAAYAKRVRDLAFDGYEVCSISLFDFLYRWLSGMEQDGVLAGTNWTADLVGLEFIPADLKRELMAQMKCEILESYRDKLAVSLKEQNSRQSSSTTNNPSPSS